MKINTYIAITLISTPFILYSATAQKRFIKLEHGSLRLADGRTIAGIGITGETIELIKQYQSNIVKILKGGQNLIAKDGAIVKYIYQYSFEGTSYSAQELRKIEETLGQKRSPKQSSELQEALKKIRSDFEYVSEVFKKIARASRSTMRALIEESCMKRNRDHNSLILLWARSNEDEYELFNRHIHSIKDFEIFMTDLYNFLGDLINSCPRAQAQFKERVIKFKKIKELIPSINVDKSQENRFLQYIHDKLDTIQLKEINSTKVLDLYKSFKKS